MSWNSDIMGLSSHIALGHLATPHIFAIIQILGVHSAVCSCRLAELGRAVWENVV